MKRGFALVVVLTAVFSPAVAETVDVKYRGALDLKSFACSDITRSSFIRRVCYDRKNQYMVIKLKNTYYHYCEIGENVVAALLAADSMGRYYNQNIKVPNGNFDCQTKRVPSY